MAKENLLYIFHATGRRKREKKKNKERNKDMKKTLIIREETRKQKILCNRSRKER